MVGFGTCRRGRHVGTPRAPRSRQPTWWTSDACETCGGRLERHPYAGFPIAANVLSTLALRWRTARRTLCRLGLDASTLGRGTRRGKRRRPSWARGTAGHHSRSGRALTGRVFTHLPRLARERAAMAPQPRCAVVVVGSGGVGKSAITLSFVREKYGHAAWRSSCAPRGGGG